MKTPQSSNIAEISFKSNILTIEFKTSSKVKDAKQEFVYQYKDVPKELWKKFQQTQKEKGSVGKLFVAEVKNKFEFEKIEKEKKYAPIKTGME